MIISEAACHSTCPLCCSCPVTWVRQALKPWIIILRQALVLQQRMVTHLKLLTKRTLKRLRPIVASVTFAINLHPALLQHKGHWSSVSVWAGALSGRQNRRGAEILHGPNRRCALFETPFRFSMVYWFYQDVVKLCISLVAEPGQLFWIHKYKAEREGQVFKVAPKVFPHRIYEIDLQLQKIFLICGYEGICVLIIFVFCVTKTRVEKVVSVMSSGPAREWILI